MLYIIAIIILILLELCYFRLAQQFDIADNACKRSSHKERTIRGGGFIFFAGAWLWYLFFGQRYGYFMAGLSIAAIVSFIDDIKSLNIKTRLIAQISAISLVFVQLGIYSDFAWWTWLIWLIMAVGIVNAFNFMDGINGITCSYSISVLLPLIYLNNTCNFIDSSYLVLAAASVLIFGYFNFRKKAICFAGDVGSISIAVIIIFALLQLIIKTGNYYYFTLLAVYGTDTGMTLLRRVSKHENLWLAHRTHAYQIMVNEMGKPHLAVAILYSILQLFISAGLILCNSYHYTYMAIVIVVLSISYWGFMAKTTKKAEFTKREHRL